MFGTRSASGSAGIIGASIGLLIAIVVATGMNFWLVAEIRKEQFAVDEIVRGGVQEDIYRLGTLPAELHWQLIFTIIVLVVLVVSAATLAFLVRAYLRSQATLRDTMTLARDILGSIDYGVITTDTDGTVTSINSQATKLLAIESKPIGLPLAKTVSLETPLAKMCGEVLAQGTAIHDREFTVHAQDCHRELRADCHRLRSADLDWRGTVLHVRDVTEQSLLEQRMRRMERFMGLGALADGLHHEIKNPLSALSLHLQLLEEGLTGQIDEHLAENLNVLKTEVTRITGVLESFRDYASLGQLNTMPLDVAQVAQQTTDLISPQAQKQEVTVKCRSESEQLPLVIGDAVKLQQVLLNLAINAMEAMRQGGRLSFLLRHADDQVIISVSDTGPGIPENVKASIFDPYFTTKSNGSGMGLAFCDKIIRQHGGQMSFDTDRDGTVFHIALPTVREE